MKSLLILLLTIVLINCKDKSNENEMIPAKFLETGLPGTYSKTFRMEERGVFQQIFSEHTSFQETVTVVITKTGTGDYDYRMEVTLFGTTTKAKTPDANYGLTADLKGEKGYNIDGSPALMFRGDFANLVPNSPDFNGSQLVAHLKSKTNSLDFRLLGSYREDIGGLVATNLPKIK